MSKMHPAPTIGRVLSALLALTLSAAGWAQGQVASCHPLPPELGGKSNVRTKALETNLRPAIVQDKAQRFTLAERMAAYQVPGVSIAVIHNGKIDWARGWGVRDLASCRPVTADTAFQAASISKLATAIMALRAVEQGMPATITCRCSYASIGATSRNSNQGKCIASTFIWPLQFRSGEAWPN